MAKMSFLNVLFCLLLSCTQLFAASPPTVTDSAHGIKYVGAASSGVEQFLNIRFGQDTGGVNRFKHPQAYTYASGTTVKATKLGPACPAKTLQSLFGFSDNGGVSSLSEDCLNLRLARPAGTQPSAGLPVMVWIYGVRVVRVLLSL